MKRHILFLTALAVSGALLTTSCSADPQTDDIRLENNWFIQSSAVTPLDGEELSTPGQDLTTGWYKASVPCTVLGALTAENGMYPDIFKGRNYKEIDREQFDTSWWYVTSFDVPQLRENQRACLAFDGISYRADIWLNGTQIASAQECFGPFRQFSYDVTEHLGENNTLAVKVYRWQKGEFNIGFVDWNPRPADESMGIFRPVWLRYSDAVSVRNTAVKTQVDTAELDEAWLTVETTLCNASDKDINGKLRGKLDGKTFTWPVEIAAGETRTITLTHEDVKALHMKNPRLWWCHNLGSPEMYTLQLDFIADGKVSDGQTIDFGVRQIDSYMTPENYRAFVLNGRKVLIKGAGWTDDIFLRNSDERNAIEVSYVKDMNMNAIRFEEVWGTSQNIYDECDRQGILALVGWSCHWEWEVYTGKPNDRYGCISSEEDIDLIAESFEDQVLWLRNHPCIIGWYAASDMLPRQALEQRYLDILERVDGTRPYMVHAGSAKSPLSGPAGMKMWGPYEWQAPYYWYSDEARGNAVGFNTEIGIGAQLPVKESLMKFIPEDQLWPVGDAYDFHCTTSREALHDLNELKMVIEKRHGGATDLDDFLRKAHFIDYEGTRAMIEAHRVNVPRSTGVIQWMLNSAWPALYWQMYDWYLVPVSGYWSVKRGCCPQQLIYNYADRQIYAVNDEKEERNLTARMRIYDLEGNMVSEKSKEVTLSTGCSFPVFQAGEIDKVEFMFLSFEDGKGNVVARNEYCLAEKEDRHNWKKYRWWRTQMETYADFSPMNDLAKADLEVSAGRTEKGAEVTIENRSSVVALLVRMDIKDASGEILTPVFWNDNMSSLAPGEKCTFSCTCPDGLPENAVLSLHGWNSEASLNF